MSDGDVGLVEGSGDGQAPMGGQIRGAAMDARAMIAEIRVTNEKVDRLIEIVTGVAERIDRMIERADKEGIKLGIVRTSDKGVLEVIREGGKIGDEFPFSGNLQFGMNLPQKTQE